MVPFILIFIYLYKTKSVWGLCNLKYIFTINKMYCNARKDKKKIRKSMHPHPGYILFFKTRRYRELGIPSD